MNKDIKLYIEATVDASRRSRRVALLIAFGSIIAITSIWNSRQTSWAQQRYDAITNANRYYLSENLGSTKTKLDELWLDSLDTASVQRFVETTKLQTRDEFDNLSKIYSTLLEDIYTVKIPLFGITLDVNDLGIFSGASFTLFLLVFAFCLSREFMNLKLTFAKINQVNDEQKQYYFELLSMNQVLTITPPFKGLKTWSFFPLFLSALPALTQVSVFVFDVTTIEFGHAISVSATNQMLIVSAIFVLSTMTLSALCIKQLVDIMRIWSKSYIPNNVGVD